MYNRPMIYIYHLSFNPRSSTAEAEYIFPSKFHLVCSTFLHVATSASNFGYAQLQSNYALLCANEKLRLHSTSAITALRTQTTQSGKHKSGDGRREEALMMVMMVEVWWGESSWIESFSWWWWGGEWWCWWDIINKSDEDWMTHWHIYQPIRRTLPTFAWVFSKLILIILIGFGSPFL